MVEINWLGHSSFQLKTKIETIYIDPFRIKEGMDAADIILITHEHFDHCSPEDIEIISSPNTIIISNVKTLAKINSKNKQEITIGQTIEIDNIKITAVPAYNIGKTFHPKEKGYCGYIIEIDDTKIYHAGDTDLIPEMKNIVCDYALLPISGTYTMTPEEAANAAEQINAKTFIPIHYGSIAGASDLGEIFKEFCELKENFKDKKVEIKEIYDGK
ncbi:MAG: MBL fold metallo-hydrolase [Candidatus Woesearchaeota archaeon]|jgi:L-ascorbate metabolism protein UlaG (beta-lactamase superfamily)